ncbi:hypothetical protein PI124_g16007 [Phytophthora idaei]|nr:hypothetical protein PI124_g16007 [Phytophthora idaei]
MNSDEYAKVLVEKVFPAIRAKWPGPKRRPVRVQHDNASPHGVVTTAAVKQAAKEGGWDIRMEFQPHKSPDMNILDLGIFNAIQSVQYRQLTYKIDALIGIVMAAFNMLPSRTLDK